MQDAEMQERRMSVDMNSVVAGFQAEPVTDPHGSLVALAFSFVQRDGSVVSACLPRDVCLELLGLLTDVAGVEWVHRRAASGSASLN